MGSETETLVARWLDLVGPPPVPVLSGPWRIGAMTPGGDDVDLVWRWMNSPHVAAAWDQAWPRERWAGEIERQAAGAHSRPCLAYLDGEPVAYLELYRVLRDRLAPLYPCRPHDLGVHIAIGAPGDIGRGLGRSLLAAVAAGLLAAEETCTRVVAEPNVLNTASIRAFTAAGFRRAGEVTLPHKTAALLVHPRTEEDLPQW
ncbi:siderophore biosynthesis protein [Microtetraspora sp. NBRC 13810]|uniref:GNAT family N-acetyltransferase n=1 Tax=Microtetraspora sp. NBRC 13810 TaxID=3030990 RepID=UPI0024A38A22|nr:GNAT family N-acetyltransferase [Microtetraspora sp. NBRC 13810]GLW12943.1 siderophore biosynthesis protein [Microtetraspora sp. NBRC 13810]